MSSSGIFYIRPEIPECALCNNFQFPALYIAQTQGTHLLDIMRRPCTSELALRVYSCPTTDDVDQDNDRYTGQRSLCDHHNICHTDICRSISTGSNGMHNHCSLSLCPSLLLSESSHLPVLSLCHACSGLRKLVIFAARHPAKQACCLGFRKSRFAHFSSSLKLFCKFTYKSTCFEKLLCLGMVGQNQSFMLRNQCPDTS